MGKCTAATGEDAGFQLYMCTYYYYYYYYIQRRNLQIVYGSARATERAQPLNVRFNDEDQCAGA